MKMRVENIGGRLAFVCEPSDEAMSVAEGAEFEVRTSGQGFVLDCAPSADPELGDVMDGLGRAFRSSSSDHEERYSA